MKISPFSSRPFHGLFVDIRNKIPFYISDYTDCASLQCIAATLYLYLVCLCSVVAFGGMLGAATDNYMVRIIRNRNRSLIFKKTAAVVSHQSIINQIKDSFLVFSMNI